MNPDEYLPQAAAFVAIVLVVAGGVAVVGALRAPPAPDYGQDAPSQFRPESALATVSDETGEIDVPEGEPKTVLIDRNHGNAFAKSEIEPFVSALVENGHRVRYLGAPRGRPLSGQEFNNSLKNADAFVIINPTRSFTPAQINGLEAFADGGGRVILLSDPKTLRTSLLGVRRVVPRTTELAGQFGITIGSGYLYNMRTEGRDNNFQNIYAAPDGTGALTEDVDRVVMWNAAPISTSGEASILLTGVEGTRLSSTRRAGTYGVLARSGNVTVVGDTSFLSPSSAYDASNEVLIGNLIEFLVTGEKVDCIFPSTGPGPRRVGTPVENAPNGPTC